MKYCRFFCLAFSAAMAVQALAKCGATECSLPRAVDQSLRDYAQQQKALQVAMKRAAVFFETTGDPASPFDSAYLNGALNVVHVGTEDTELMKAVRARAKKCPVRTIGNLKKGFVGLIFFEAYEKKGVGYNIAFFFEAGRLKRWTCSYDLYMGVISQPELNISTKPTKGQEDLNGAGR